jgi:EAL domain-containing protein (putative c-di-GMP-specific phosphodiesterase class I)/ActR/RegA family two-component response regulator
MSNPAELHVMILEDDPFQRSVLAAALKKLGVGHVTEVADGHAGLAALRSYHAGFDIVISDLDMEGMDGLEFIRHAAKCGVGGLILCSGLDASVVSSAEWLVRAYKAPLLGVLTKPVNAQALARLINSRAASRLNSSEMGGGLQESEPADRDVLDEIAMGLETRQFVPFYQPKVSLKTGEMVGAEILARWEHPERGLLMPIHFIDLMESNGLIEGLTAQVLDQACNDSERWLKAGLKVPLALNVSASTLEQSNSANQLLARIAATVLPTALFTIELTETAFAHDMKGLLENVLRLRMNGCGVSVDDFGTGYSSLQQLSRVPVTELKVDRSFVRRIPENDKALSIVGSMIDLARKLELKTVAEGIETPAQLECLKGLGCDIGQGYLFGRPMARDAFSEWCAAHQV